MQSEDVTMETLYDVHHRWNIIMLREYKLNIIVGFNLDLPLRIRVELLVGAQVVASFARRSLKGYWLQGCIFLVWVIRVFHMTVSKYEKICCLLNFLGVIDDRKDGLRI